MNTLLTYGRFAFIDMFTGGLKKEVEGKDYVETVRGLLKGLEDS